MSEHSELDQAKVCIACDCVDDVAYYSPVGAGPFCGECWNSLTDPDQSLLLEKRLEQAEEALEQSRLGLAHERYKARVQLDTSAQVINGFKALLASAADALEFPFHSSRLPALIANLRKAAQ